MAREMLKLPNNKKGLFIMLIIEVLVAGWAVAATFYALRVGRTSTAIYGFIVLFAIFYILGRSLRSFRDLSRREREQKARGEEERR